ncbi:MAG: zinc-binding dehydrogenase [Christensenellales bacterium]
MKPAAWKLQAKALSETDGWGADVVIECSGSPKAIEQGIAMVRKTGQYSGVGLARQEIIQFP